MTSSRKRAMRKASGSVGNCFTKDFIKWEVEANPKAFTDMGCGVHGPTISGHETLKRCRAKNSENRRKKSIGGISN